jgi:hypothetical protein
VYKQPATEEEKNLCEEALTCCPVEAIEMMASDRRVIGSRAARKEIIGYLRIAN